ncbi:MAG: hypothetical protein MJ170_03980 [Alphaproteobacteria bacterium]|nr:hypothetical protein [Alphaproteobacteria bacterium]
MLNEYRKFLVKNGFAVIVNGRNSTCYDYCRALKRVAKIENITIEKLAENISDICPMYLKGGPKQVLGAGMSRSIRSSLVQLKKMMLESQAA